MNGYSYWNDRGSRHVSEWYLLQTKAQLEHSVSQRLKALGVDVLLPLLRRHVHRWGRLVTSVGPLFPRYLFILPKEGYRQDTIEFLPGVRGLVRFGDEPAPVPPSIIGELQRRCAGGPIELPLEPLRRGMSVRVTHGPFSKFEGIFERYLSGTERVAILLSVLGAATVRLLLPAAYAEPLRECDVRAWNVR